MGALTIKLYSFNGLTDIITDLNNYKDTMHYGSWINSLMLQYMHDENCLLTYENYREYLKRELSFYTSFDYALLNGQEDYENDYYADALLNEKMYGTKPVYFSEDVLLLGETNKASIVLDQYDGTAGVECKGSLRREPGSQVTVEEYIASMEYIGYKFTMDDIMPYKYLSFYGMKGVDQGQPGIYIYGENNEVMAKFTADYSGLDAEWHQYLINISQLSGRVTIVFNGGYIDNTGSSDSLYTFSNIVFY